MKIKGTVSEQNLLAAFAGESQARNKYTFYALQARKEGHADIADLFERMAKNEMTHAKIWFNMLYEDYDSTDVNLQEAASGENYEWKIMYPEFAAQAREDGLEDLAEMFEKVASIENDHERTFMKAFIKIKNNSDIVAASIPEPETVNNYRCMFCGAEYPDYKDVCPVCEAIGAFEQISKN